MNHKLFLLYPVVVQLSVAGISIQIVCMFVFKLIGLGQFSYLDYQLRLSYFDNQMLKIVVLVINLILPMHFNQPWYASFRPFRAANAFFPLSNKPTCIILEYFGCTMLAAIVVPLDIQINIIYSCNRHISPSLYLHDLETVG